MRSASVDRRSDRRRDYSEDRSCDLVTLHERLQTVVESLVRYVRYTEDAVFGRSGRSRREQETVLRDVESEARRWEQQLLYVVSVDEALLRRGRTAEVCRPSSGTFKVASDLIAESQRRVSEAMYGRTDVHTSGKVWESFTWLNQRLFEAFFRDSSSPLRGRKSLQADDSARERENAGLRTRLAEVESALANLRRGHSPGRDDLELQLQDAQATIVLLQADIDRLKSEKAQFQCSKSSLAEDLEVARLRCDLDRIRKERDTLKSTLARGRQGEIRRSYPGPEELEREKARSRNFLQALQQKEKELEEAKSTIEQQRTADKSSEGSRDDVVKEELGRFLELIKRLEEEKTAAEALVQQHLQARLKAERELKVKSADTSEPVLVQLRLALEEKLATAKQLSQVKLELATVKEENNELQKRCKTLQALPLQVIDLSAILVEWRNVSEVFDGKVAELQKNAEIKVKKQVERLNEMQRKMEHKAANFMRTQHTKAQSAASMIASLKRERETAGKKVELLTQELEKREKNIAKLKLVVSKLSSEMEVANSQRQECVDGIEELKSVLEKERGRYAADLAAIRNHSDAAVSQEKGIRTSLETQCQRLNEELAEANRKLESAQKDLEEKQRSLQQMHSLELRLNQISASQYEKEGKEKQMEGELQALRAKLKDSESRSQRLESDLRKSTSDLSTKVKELVLAQRAADSNESIVLQSMQNLRQLEAETQQLRTDLQQTKEEKDRLKTQLTEVRKEVSSAKEQATAARDDAAKKEKAYSELRNTRESERSHLKSAKDTIQELTKRFESAQSECASLRDQLRTKTEALSALTAKASEIDSLRTQFHSASSALESHKSLLAESESRRNAAESSVASLKAELEQAQTRLREVKSSLQSAEKVTKSEAQRCSALETELEECSARVKELELEALKQAEEALEGVKECTAAKRKAAEAEGRAKTLQVEVDRLQKELETQESSSAALSHDVEALTSEVQALRQPKRQKLKAAPQESTDALRRVAEELDACRLERDALKERLEAELQKGKSLTLAVENSKKEAAAGRLLSQQLAEFLQQVGSGGSGEDFSAVEEYCRGLQSDLEESRKSAEKQRSSAQQRESDLRNKVEAANRSREEMQESAEATREQLVQMESEMEAKEKTQRELRKAISDLETSLKQKTRALTALEATLQAKTEALADVEDAHSQCAAAETALSGKLRSAEVSLQQVKSTCSAQEKELSENRENIQRLKAEVERLRDTESRKDGDAGKVVEELQKEVARRKAAHEKASAELSLQVLELQRAKEGEQQLQAQISQQSSDLQRAKAEEQQLRTQLSQQSSDLQRAKAEEQQLQAQLSQLSSELQRAKAEEQQLRTQLSLQASELQRATAEEQRTSAETSPLLRRLQEKEAGLQQEIEALEEEQVGLINEIRELQLLTQQQDLQLQETQRDNEALEAELDSNIQIREECQKLLIEAKEQLRQQDGTAALEKKVEKLTKEIEVRNNELADVTKLHRSAKAQITQLTQELETVKSAQPLSKQNLQSLISSQRTEIDDLRQTVEELKRAKELLIEEFESDGGKKVEKETIQRAVREMTRWIEQSLQSIQDRLVALDRRTMQQWGNCTFLIQRLQHSAPLDPSDSTRRYQKLLAEAEGRNKKLQKMLDDTPKGVNPFHLADFIEDVSAETEKAMRIMESKLSSLQERLDYVVTLLPSLRHNSLSQPSLTYIFSVVGQHSTALEARVTKKLAGLEGKVKRLRNCFDDCEDRRKTQCEELRAEISAARIQLRQMGVDVQRKSLTSAISEVFRFRPSSHSPIDPSTMENSEITILTDVPELKKQESELGPLVDTVARLYKENEEQAGTLEALAQENALLKDAMKHGGPQGSDRLASTLLNLLGILPEQYLSCRNSEVESVVHTLCDLMVLSRDQVKELQTRRKTLHEKSKKQRGR